MLFLNNHKSLIFNRLRFVIIIPFFLVGGISLLAQKKNKKEEKLLKQEQELRQAEEYFIEGNKEYLLGRFDKAMDWLQRAHKIQPQNAAFCFKLAECYTKHNNIEKAISLAEKSVQLDLKNKYYSILLAQLYERNKKYKDAIKIYEKLVKQSPENNELLMNIANLQLFMNDFNGAIKTFDKLEVIYGTNEELVRQKQLLYLKQNKLEDAISEWKKLIAANPENQNLVLDLANLLYINNRNSEAKKLLEEFLAKNTDTPFASLVLSEIYLKEGKKAESEKEMEKAFLSPQLNIDAKIGVIISMLRQMQSDSSVMKQAIRLGDILVKVHPNEAKAFAMNGDVLTIQEKKQAALDNYIKSISLDNSHFKIWQQIIFLSTELNQNDTVIKYVDKAIEVFPTQPFFFYYGGSAYLSKKKYTEAINQFESGKKVIVNNNDFLVQFLSQLGDSYNGLKNFAKSDSSYEDALKIDPENAHVLNNYSYYLSLRKEKLDLAKKMCEKMLVKKPDEPAYLDTYGWVLYQLKDYTNAKKYIEKALEKTNDATIIEHYGDILYQLGERDSAMLQWEKAKKGEGYSDLLDKKIEGKQLYE